MTRRNRQLAAIVFTDIVGYSALMRQDESRASAVRKRHRSIFETLTPKYGGRLLQYYGDGTLSIFNSTVEAVACSVEMQREFSNDPAVPLRIGIHTGDIIYDDVDVFGDGVNVASRIEPCCIPGGIYISGRVFDDIRNHEWLSARPLGEFTFKGLDDPLQLYAIDNEGVAVPTEKDIQELRHSEAKLVAITRAPVAAPAIVPERVRQVALVSIPILLLGLILLNLFQPRIPNVALADVSGEPAIAVLPFTNFGDQQEDSEYFSDGITEDILTLLSKIEGLKVISRTSVMQYKETNKDIRQIGRELNADHILEGSVRRQGNKVRIVAQLIDARNDNHLWSETYDQEIDEIFEVQSKVAQEIAMALKKELSPKDQEMIHKKPTENVVAYDLYLQGREFYSHYTPDYNDLAIRMFERALRVDSSFALAYAGLGDALAQKSFLTDHDPAILDSAILMSTQAIALDRELSEGYKALGLALHYQGKFDEALEEYFKAVERNPSNAMAINNIGLIYQERGNMVEAIHWARKAFSINPHYEASIFNLARLYFLIGDDVQSELMVDRGIAVHPDYIPLRYLKADLFLQNGNYPGLKEQALKIIGMENDNPAGYELMGHSVFYTGDYETSRTFYEKALQVAGRSSMKYEPWDSEIYLGVIDIRQGRPEAGRERLRNLLSPLKEKAEKTGKVDYLGVLSAIHAALGEDDQALALLEKAVNKDWMGFRMVTIHPAFDNLRKNPRFQKLMQDLQIRQEGIRGAVDGMARKAKMS